MSQNANRWKLGLFVVGGLATSIGGLVWVGVARLKPIVHEAFMFFDEAVNGLDTGSQVKFRGMPIGRVGEIVVAEDMKHLRVQVLLLDKALMALHVDPEQLGPGRALPAGLRAQMVQSWVTGISFVQVDYFPADSKPAEPLPFDVPENTIQTVRSTFKSFEDGVRELLRDTPSLMLAAKDLLQEVRDELKAAALPQLGRRADDVLAQLQQKIADFDRLPVVASAQGALDEVKALAADLRQPEHGVLRQLEVLSQDLRAAIAAADVGNLSKSVQGAGAAAGAAAGEFAALGRDLRGELLHLRHALQAVERLAELLERDPGALLHGRGDANSPLKK
jgi:ABC-type transporter Mla subunit MlaD